MDLQSILIAVIASGTVSALLAHILNRRINRANERVAGYSGDKQLDELLNDLQVSQAKNGRRILALERRQNALEGHLDDLYAAIGQEATEVQERIKGRLTTKRPNGRKDT